MKNLMKNLAAFLAVVLMVCMMPSGSAFAAKKLNAPTPSAYTSGSNITVKWSKVKNATGYKVYYTTDSKFKKGVKSCTTTKTSTTVTKLKHYTKYYIRVKSCEGKKKKPCSSYSKTVSAVTDVPASYIKSLSCDEDAITVYTSTASKCFYQISYSTDKAEKKNVKYKTTSSTNVTIPVHDNKGKACAYYLRVRSQRKNGSKTVSSNWSSVKSVKTKNVNYPKQPWVTSSSTALSGSTASLTVNFNNYGGNITAYQVEVSTNNTFKTIAATAQTPGKSVKVNNLKQDTVYYYRVRGVRNVQGKEYYGDWYTPNDSGFVTGSTYAQNAPVVTLSTSNHNRTVNAKWTMSSNTYSSVSYVVQCSTDRSFTNNSKITKEITQTGTSASFDAEYYNTYYVRAKAVLTYNSKTYTTPWSAVKSVTSKNPYEITDSVKISSVTAAKTSVTAQWASIANATGYEVQLAANKDFANSTTQKTAALSVTFDGLMDGTTYYVRVRAYNDASEKAYYSSWTTQSVTTKSDVINEGVVFTTVYTKNGGRCGYTVNKPCIYSEKIMDLYGDKHTNYVALLKQRYAEIGIDSSMSDVEKFVLIADWMSCNLTYGEANAGSGVIGKRSQYDGLTTGRAVCYGYAGIFNDFCYLAGVPCYYMVSDPDQTAWYHAYNAIKLQGNWYLFDPQSGAGMPEDPNSDELKESLAESECWGDLVEFQGIHAMATALHPAYAKMANTQCKPFGTNATHKALDPMWLTAYNTAYHTTIVCRNSDKFQRLQQYGYSVIAKSW